MKAQRQTTGFTLVEMMLATVVLLVLLCSASMAIHASFTSHRENNKMSASSSTARSVLERIARDIRTAGAVDPFCYEALRIVPQDDGSGVTEIRYVHNYETHSLDYVVEQDGETTTYPLIGGEGDEVKVQHFYPVYQTEQRTEGESVITVTTRVTVWLELECDGHRLQMRTSASPRINQKY